MSPHHHVHFADYYVEFQHDVNHLAERLNHDDAVDDDIGDGSAGRHRHDGGSVHRAPRFVYHDPYTIHSRRPDNDNSAG